MLLYEIDRSDLRKHGNIKNVIAAGEYITRTEEFITRAFNFGRGTPAHMNKYMRDNNRFCLWVDPQTMQEVKRI